ncbi:MAG: hypothetical protein VX796_05245, partial [Pseudomonadota bacterium]|nr:hypothetical protein [Pseudomonadota bacterium]
MKPTGKMISLLPWLFQTQFASQARKKRLAAEEVVGMDDNIVVPESGIEDQPRKTPIPDDRNLVTVTETFVVAEGEAVNDDLSSTDADADDKVTTSPVDPATAIGEEATSSRIGDSEAVESEVLELPLGDAAREGGAHAAMMSQAFMDALNTGLFDPKWYQATYGLRFSTQREAFDDYIRKSRFAPVNPSPRFDSETYHRMYIDVFHAQQSPLQHYLLHGR